MDSLERYTATGEPEEIVREIMYNAEEQEYMGSAMAMATIKDYAGEFQCSGSQ